MRTPGPRRRAQLEDYPGIEMLVGIALGGLSLVAGALGWYGVARSRGRRSGLGWIVPAAAVALSSLVPLAYFISLYAGEAETEVRFFLVFIGGCAASWAIVIALYRRWRKDSQRRRGQLSGTGLL